MENTYCKPLISIIIPFYNGKSYIEECVNSALNQDYDNIEIILIDDGSTDGSEKIADNLSLNHSKIKVYHQENAGVSAARNYGIEMSKGEYITFVDVDDYISTQFISYFYNLIKQYKAQIALVPTPRKFNEKNKYEITVDDDYIEIWSGIKATCEMLYYNITIGPWNKLISKQLINDFGLKFNTNLSYGEGFNFSVDCFQRADTIVVGHRRLYNYRVDNPNSVMTKFKLKLVTGSIEAQKAIRNNLVIINDDLINACRYANWHTHCDCLNTILGCKVEKTYKEIYKDVKKVSRQDALCVFKSHISFKEKIKGLMYFISPYLAARFINYFRIRKFTIVESED